jgi:hypothetical protein
MQVCGGISILKVIRVIQRVWELKSDGATMIMLFKRFVVALCNIDTEISHGNEKGVEK